MNESEEETNINNKKEGLEKKVNMSDDLEMFVSVCVCV